MAIFFAPTAARNGSSDHEDDVRSLTIDENLLTHALRFFLLFVNHREVGQRKIAARNAF